MFIILVSLCESLPTLLEGGGVQRDALAAQQCPVPQLPNVFSLVQNMKKKDVFSVHEGTGNAEGDQDVIYGFINVEFSGKHAKDTTATMQWHTKAGLVASGHTGGFLPFDPQVVKDCHGRVLARFALHEASEQQAQTISQFNNGANSVIFVYDHRHKLVGHTDIMSKKGILALRPGSPTDAATASAPAIATIVPSVHSDTQTVHVHATHSLLTDPRVLVFLANQKAAGETMLSDSENKTRARYGVFFAIIACVLLGSAAFVVGVVCCICKATRWGAELDEEEEEEIHPVVARKKVVPNKATIQGRG